MNYEDINSKEKNIRNLRAKIEVLYDIKKLEMLIEEGKKLLAIEPNDTYALNMMGLAYERLGKLEEAEAVALNYLKLYPNDADAHALYGEVLCSKEKYDEAVVEYNKAIELDPMESYHYCKLAINLFISDHKNLNRSIELVLHALELNPNNAIFHSYLSEQYINAGRLDDAQNECLKALELGPDIAIVRGQYGKLQMLFQNFDEAEEHIIESLRLNPMNKLTQEYLNTVKEYKKDIKIYFRRMIEYYLELRKDAEAENIALKYIKEYPSDAKAHELYAQILYNKNSLEQAIEEFNMAIELDGADEFLYYILAVSLHTLNKKNIVQPMELVLKALEISPDNGQIRAFLGYLYLRSYNFEDGEKECLKALELDPKNAYVQAQWGQIQLFSGNINDAKKHIDEALRLNPDEELAKNVLKNMEPYKENMPLYLKHMTRYHSHCLKKYPQCEKGRLILSKMLIEKGNIEKAIYEFKKYLVLRPEDSEECINFAKLMSKEIGERKTLLHFKSLHKEYPNNEAISNYIETINKELDLKEIDLKEGKKPWVIYAAVVIIVLIIKFLS